MSVLFKLLGQLVILTLLGLGLSYGIEWFTNQQIPQFQNALAQVFSNGIFQLGILLLITINIRAMLFRLSDKDI